MPSPFPGMNPYLESANGWEAFHPGMITTMSQAINRVLPPGYHARYETLLFINEPAAEDRGVRRPDVSVLGPDGAGPASRPDSALADAPAYAVFPEVWEEKHRFITIYGRNTGQIVTAVELLSESNKPGGRHHDLYLSKRTQLLNGGTHLVEIDLLRGHGRMPMEPTPEADYVVAVARADEKAVAVWPIGLRHPLPTIPVPLAGDDPAVPLDLQAALQKTHDDNFFDRFLYDRGLNDVRPPLSAADAAWAAERVAVMKAAS